MSLFTDGISTISVGETLIGTDDGRLVNTRLEGREAWVSHEDIVKGSGVSLFSGALGIRSRVRVMRNTSGTVLNAGELVLFNGVTGAAAIGKATGLAGADAPFWVVVDPTLTSGVANNDLFIAFIGGPAKVKLPASPITLAAANLPIVSAASGRATFGATDGTEVQIIGGRFICPTGSQTGNALVDVVLNLPWV